MTNSDGNNSLQNIAPGQTPQNFSSNQGSSLNKSLKDPEHNTILEETKSDLSNSNSKKDLTKSKSNESNAQKRDKIKMAPMPSSKTVMTQVFDDELYDPHFVTFDDQNNLPTKELQTVRETINENRAQ